MTTTHPLRNLSVSINRDARDVYSFVCVPENFPRWASGLGKFVEAGKWRVGRRNTGRSGAGQVCGTQ